MITRLPRGDEKRPPAPFIVGSGRSGTTLLRMMLDSHSSLAIPPETNFSVPLKVFQKEGAKAAAERAVHSQPWRDFNISGDEFVRRVEELDSASFGDVMRTFYQLYAEQMGKLRWGDKSPYYLAGMTKINRHLPEAHFIHVIRDGRDVALSMVPLWFGPNSFPDLARWWVERLEMARSQAAELPFYIEVHYESLVREPAETLGRVCDYLELEWEDSMLDYHLHAAERMASETNSLKLPDRPLPKSERLGIHQMLNHPPQRDRTERWRREMDPADLRAFESIAGEALSAFGYEVSSEVAAAR